MTPTIIKNSNTNTQHNAQTPFHFQAQESNTGCKNWNNGDGLEQQADAADGLEWRRKGTSNNKNWNQGQGQGRKDWNWNKPGRNWAEGRRIFGVGSPVSVSITLNLFPRARSVYRR